MAMIAYEFYYSDGEGKFHLIGILPERRQSPRRITQGSVMDWGRELIGNNSRINQLYFIQVEV
jgi:hypothetical protein